MAWRDPRILSLVLVQVVVGSGFALLIPTLPRYITSLGGQASDLGLFNAAYAVAMLVSAPAWGAWSDRVGRRSVLIIGALGLGATYLALPIAPDLQVAFALRFLGGVFAAGTIPASFAYVVDVTTPEERGSAMGAVSAGMGMAFVISPVIGGVLAEVGVAVPFLLAAAAAGLSAILVTLMLPSVAPRAATVLVQGRTPSRFEALRPLAPVLLVTFLIGLAESIRPTALALYTTDDLGFTASELGLVFSAMGLAFVLSQWWLVGPLIGRVGEKGTILVGQPITIAGMLLMLVVADVPGVTVANFLQGMGMAFGFTAIPVYISRIATSGQGAAMGYRTSTMSFAQVMGPLAAGAAYAIAPAVPFSVSAALVAGAMVVASVGLRVRPAPSELAPDTLSWPTGVSDPPDVGEVARIDRPASATGAER
jgi:MFS family permease